MNDSNSSRERASLIGVCGTAATKETAELLIKVAEDLGDAEMKKVALSAIGRVGALWGDGSYHEERAPVLDRAWRASNDQGLLIFVAEAMAQVGAPSSVELLLSAALSDDKKGDARKRAAEEALTKVHTNNALPAVVALLENQSSVNQSTVLACNMLVRIGDAESGRVLMEWIRKADKSVAPAVSTFVMGTRTPEILDAWGAAIDARVSFKSEENREMIARALKEYRDGIAH